MAPSAAANSLLSPLKNLRLSQLQRVAQACGVVKSGAKTAVTQNVVDELRQTQAVSTGERILSIDMGIRNLAFCLLTPRHGGDGSVVDSSSSSSSSPTTAKRRTTTTRKSGSSKAPSSSSSSPSLSFPSHATLHHWKVLDLTTAQDFFNNGVGGGDGDGRRPPFNLRSTRDLSAAAVKLVLEQMLPLRPTRILIEQQRWRSAGGAGVQEWTVRVNTLEAMLFATLATLRAQKHWDGTVESVDPKRTAPFFFVADPNAAGVEVPLEPPSQPTRSNGKKKSQKKAAVGKRAAKSKVVEEEAEAELEEVVEEVDEEDQVRSCRARARAAGGKLETKRLKKMKTDLLGAWLLDRQQGRVRPLGEQAEGMAQSFLGSWQGKGGKGVIIGGEEQLKKLDDLSDCVVQGMAWLRWQENRARLLERGPEAFLESLEA